MASRGWLADLRSGAIGRNVVALGFTSFFTDISSEMVAAALPAYAVLHLGLSPQEFGTVDGIQRGAALLVGVALAFLTDRGRRHKRTALVGYATSAVCKLALWFGTSVSGALGWILLVDRAGKGLRSPARDALIAASSAPRVLAAAFGLHRALDTAGALLGPLAAFAVLKIAPGAFDAIFVVSLCAAVVGLCCMALFVEDEAEAGRARLSLRDATGVLVDPRFRPLIVVAFVLALGTVSESFLYVALQRSGSVGGDAIPLLFAGTAVAQLAVTLPAARIADRVGRWRVFLGGHVFLLAAYAVLLAGDLGESRPGLLVVSLGLFLAATDGVLMALSSAALAADRRASGLALVTAAIGAGRLAASVVFGAVWTATGAAGAILTFGGAILLALPFAFVVLRARQREFPEHARPR